MLKIFTLRNIALFFVALWLWKKIISDWIDINYNLPFFGAGSIENYGDTHLHYGPWLEHSVQNCEPTHSATQECSQVAQSTCDTTNDKLNGCWMPAFLKCSASSPNSQTNCYKYANSSCGGSLGECADCYSNAHQTCMSQKGIGVHPNCTQ